MAHFAQLDENNVVLNVIVVSNDDIKDENGDEKEELGIEFLKNLLGKDTRWVQTSYNGNIRKIYAGVGYTYNQSLDAFITPKPYESWILDENECCWIPPVTKPELTQEQIYQGCYYEWSEELYNTDQTGWIINC